MVLAEVPFILIELFLMAHLKQEEISETTNVKKRSPTTSTYINYRPKERRSFRARLLGGRTRLTNVALHVLTTFTRDEKTMRKGTTAIRLRTPGSIRQYVEPIFTTLSVLTRRAICTAFSLEVTPEFIPLVRTRYTTSEENLSSTTLWAAQFEIY